MNQEKVVCRNPCTTKEYVVRCRTAFVAPSITKTSYLKSLVVIRRDHNDCIEIHLAKRCEFDRPGSGSTPLAISAVSFSQLLISVQSNKRDGRRFRITSRVFGVAQMRRHNCSFFEQEELACKLPWLR